MSNPNDPTDDNGLSLRYYQNTAALFYATTALSLATNLAVCAFHGLLAFYGVIELNRISLRLIALSASFEVIRAIFRMAMIVPADTTTCAADSFFVSWSNVASTMCLALVGVHAVCVLVLNVDKPRQLEKYYYATIFIYSTVVCGIAAKDTPIGYLHDFQCWVRFYFGKKTVNQFEWTWYYTALMLPITVAFICSLILLIRYKMERYNFVETSVRYAPNNTKSILPVLSNRFKHVDPIKIFRNVIIRSFFYALIPLISKLSVIVDGFRSLLRLPVTYQSLIAGAVLTNAQGVLISILYFSDPAVVYTMKRFGHFLRKVYVDDYVQGSPLDRSSSPPDSFDDRMRERYGSDFGETEDCWAPAIQLTPIHHDMIADDATDEQPINGDSEHKRRRSSAQLWGKSYTNPPWDPYYNRCLAKTMHWLLTSVCRLKPLPYAESSSTLSYRSYAMASHNSLPNDAPPSDAIQIVTNATDDTTRKKSSKLNRMDNTPDKTERQYLTLPNTTAAAAAAGKATRLSPSSSESPTNSSRSQGKSSSRGSSPLSLAQKSKKLGLSLRHPNKSRTPSSPTSSSSKQSSLHLSQTSSLHLPDTSSSSVIDRLSLLSSVESDINRNKGYEPLSVPPHHYHHRQRSQPSFTITLPDERQATPPPSSSDETSTTSSPIVKHGGIKLQPAVLKALILDWEPHEPDGLEDGWTSIIHIGQTLDSDSHRIVSFVEHWFRDYLGSRWFVVE